MSTGRVGRYTRSGKSKRRLLCCSKLEEGEQEKGVEGRKSKAKIMDAL
jgi:hypothetical protein